MGFKLPNLKKVFSPRGSGGLEANQRAASEAANEARARATETYDLGKMLSGRYTGALDTLLPGRDILSYLLNPTANAGANIPSWMQVQDRVGTIPEYMPWQDVARDVEGAYGTMGSLDIGDTYQRRLDELTADAARRGILGRGSLDESSRIGLENWRDRSTAEMGAQGRLSGIQAGQNAWGLNLQSALARIAQATGQRAEQGKNYWDVMNQYSNVGNMGNNLMSGGASGALGAGNAYNALGEQYAQQGRDQMAMLGGLASAGVNYLTGGFGTGGNRGSGGNQPSRGYGYPGTGGIVNSGTLTGGTGYTAMDPVNARMRNYGYPGY